MRARRDHGKPEPPAQADGAPPAAPSSQAELFVTGPGARRQADATVRGRVAAIYFMIGLPAPELRILNADADIPRLGFGRRAMIVLTLLGAGLGVAAPFLVAGIERRNQPMMLVALESAWLGVLLAFACIALGRGYARFVATEMALRRFADQQRFYLQEIDTTYPVFHRLRGALMRCCVAARASSAVRRRVATMQPGDLLRIWATVPEADLPPPLAPLKALSQRFDAMLLFHDVVFLRNTSPARRQARRG